MHDLVRVIFSRLEGLNPEETEGQAEEDAANGGNSELRMNVSPTRETITQSLEQVLDSEQDVPERDKTPVPAVNDGESMC